MYMSIAKPLHVIEWKYSERCDRSKLNTNQEFSRNNKHNTALFPPSKGETNELLEKCQGSTVKQHPLLRESSPGCVFVGEVEAPGELQAGL